ncbi:hypothetical protein JCM11641_007485 [Rhodosporidiobolus odoratus]
MLTALRPTPSPLYTPPPLRNNPSRPSSPSLLLARRPPSPARPPLSSPSPDLYRTPFRRSSISGQSPTSYSPPRPVRPPSPVDPRRLSSSGPGSSAPDALHVYGDSFCSVFTLLGRKTVVNKYKGASARGLNNPTSTLGVGPDLLQRLQTAGPSHALLMFGAVDLHVNYLWQLKAKRPFALRPQDWAQRVATEYASFLATKVVPVAQKMGTRIYIAGVTPPVVEDRFLELSSQKYLQKEDVGPLPPLSASSYPHDLATRSQMVKRFNALISSFCSRYSGLQFVDISASLVSVGDSRRVSSRFADPQDPTNIHVVWESTLAFWCQQIPPLYDAAPSHPHEVARLERTLEAWRLEKRERMKHHSITRLVQA